MTEAGALLLVVRTLTKRRRTALLSLRAAGGEAGPAARVVALIAVDKAMKQTLSSRIDTKFSTPPAEIGVSRLDR